MEEITDTDYKYTKRVWKNFKINKCVEIYELDPALFSRPGLAWQVCLKKTEIELELLTDTDMLIMVEKSY